MSIVPISRGVHLDAMYSQRFSPNFREYLLGVSFNQKMPPKVCSASFHKTVSIFSRCFKNEGKEEKLVEGQDKCILRKLKVVKIQR